MSLIFGINDKTCDVSAVFVPKVTSTSKNVCAMSNALKCRIQSLHYSPHVGMFIFCFNW